ARTGREGSDSRGLCSIEIFVPRRIPYIRLPRVGTKAVQPECGVERMKPQTREHITQAGGLVLVGGGVFWAIAEIIALGSGESTVESLVISSVAFLDIAVGIWSVRMAQKEGTDPFTLSGIAALTIGFLMFAV